MQDTTIIDHLHTNTVESSSRTNARLHTKAVESSPRVNAESTSPTHLTTHAVERALRVNARPHTDRAVRDATLGASNNADASAPVGASNNADTSAHVGASNNADASANVGASNNADASAHVGASENADASARMGARSSARVRGGFVAYENALDLLRALAPVVAQLKTYDADLADQVTRAGSSITLNLQEGSGRSGRDRKRFFVMARGSAREILGALDTADAWGWRVETTRARALLDRELALLWGLCR